MSPRTRSTLHADAPLTPPGSPVNTSPHGDVLPRPFTERRVEPDLDCQPSRRRDFTGGQRYENDSTVRQLLDTVGCDGRSGSSRRGDGANQLPSDRLGYSGG